MSRDHHETPSTRWCRRPGHPNRPRTSTSMVRSRAGRAGLAVAVLVAGGCGWFDESASTRAREAIAEAEQSVHRGVEQARQRVDVDGAEQVLRETLARSSGVSPSDGSAAAAEDWLADPSAAISCEADSCTVAAGLVAQAWQEPRRAAPNLGLEPVQSQGVATGLRLRGIGPGTPAYLLGFRNGDLVQTVNHLPVAWPQNQPRLLWQLRHGRHFDVTFERDGRPLSRTVVVQ